MSFNIRYSNPGDSANAWEHRKDHAASQVLFHEVHLLGVQEALKGQLADLVERVPQFKYIGKGRADGKEKGEFSAILYDTTRLQLLQTETFWLSETPEVPGSKGWDAAIERIVTWAKFYDPVSKKIFFHFNTHYDHMGQEARRESSKLLMQKVHEIAGDLPSLITGDFNAKPSDEPIQILKDVNDPLYFIDAKEVSETPHFGPDGTFNAFGPKEIHNQPIDYIFIKNGFSVLKHATLSQTWEGRFSSDHFPVYARVGLGQ